MKRSLADKHVIAVRANEYSLRTSNPHIPYSAKELAADAIACQEAGATIFHFHARHPETGAPAWDTNSYREVMFALRDSCDMVLMPTLGASTVPNPLDRIRHIIELSEHERTRPDLVPIDMGSFNIDPYDAATKTFGNEDITYVTPISGLRTLIETCHAVDVRPAPILWSVGGARVTEAFIDSGLLYGPIYAELTLTDSLLTAHPPSRDGIEAYVNFLPTSEDFHWSCLRYGGDVTQLADVVVELGGGIALGLGDFAHAARGTPTNADLVRLAAEEIQHLGRTPATIADVRSGLHLA